MALSSLLETPVATVHEGSSGRAESVRDRDWSRESFDLVPYPDLILT